MTNEKINLIIEKFFSELRAILPDIPPGVDIAPGIHFHMDGQAVGNGGNGEEPEPTQYVKCIHPNGAKVYPEPDFEATMIAKLYEGETAPIDIIRTVDGKRYAWIKVSDYERFTNKGFEFGYAYLLEERWEIFTP